MNDLKPCRPGTTAYKVQQIEAAEREKKKREAEKRAQEKTAALRFWVTFAVAALAAFASIAGVVLQFLQG